MLTEIEWWGGLLFIWMAWCFSMLFENNESQTKIDVSSVATMVTFLCAAIVLALYFYPLTDPVMKKSYLAVSALGIFSLIVMFLWPEKDDGLPDKEVDSDLQNDIENEEDSLLWLGHLIILFPVCVALSIGGYRSYGFIHLL
ncbi:Uncharacterised protein [BD1-7 clade bacterium]|nr:Uncharacterised protein [BD1-7 clade bacterium]